MKDVIVTESPNKIKKLRGAFPAAEIVATVGHFKDLPRKDLGVDLATMEPTWTSQDRKRDVPGRLRAAAKGARVLIATDPDREGYAIATHVHEEVRRVAGECRRMEIREYTAKGMRDAYAASVPFASTNRFLYDAFLGRRVGDRLVGYVLSPVACKHLGPRFSVGRVQSPAVRLVVERERAIRAFVPEPYWTVAVLLEKDGTLFRAFHADGNIRDKAKADAVLARVLPARLARATDVDEKIARQAPKPPFTTPDLQAAAAARLRLPTDRTMKLAQDLFEAALISYHRTDSVRIADEFVAQIRDRIAASYGPDFLPPEPRRHRSKASQADAHEAVRPTDAHPPAECEPTVRAEGLSDDHVRLYDLIYRRAIASQMADALFDSTAILFDVAAEPFKAKGRVVRFDGFLRAYSDADEKKDDRETAGGEEPPDEDQRLPKILTGEDVPKTGQELKEKQTKPPGRYSEGTLVKALERLGIGRPSTYASIVRTIKDRQYVEAAKGKLHPTARGEAVHDFLARAYPWIVDYEMTKDMETALDDVEDNGADWKAFARELHGRMAAPPPGGEAAGQPRPPNAPGTAPSPKQIEYARTLSARHGVAIPPEDLADRRSLSAWIDRARGGATQGPAAGPGILPPTEKQSSYARTLAERGGKRIPPDVAADRRKLSAWIQENAPGPTRGATANGDPRPLTDKQMAVIRRHADPATVAKVDAGDLSAGRAFLDAHFAKAATRKNKRAPRKTGGRARRGPESRGNGRDAANPDGVQPASDKQIEYIRYLMEQRGFPGPEIQARTARLSRDAARKEIDALLSAH